MKVTVVFKGVTYESLNDKHFLDTANNSGIELDKLHWENDAALSTQNSQSQ
jgi:hypothetical protein